MLPSLALKLHIALLGNRIFRNGKLNGTFFLHLAARISLQVAQGLFARIPDPIQLANDTYACEENNDN